MVAQQGLGLTQMPCERKTVSFSIQRKVSGQVCGGLSVDAQAVSDGIMPHNCLIGFLRALGEDLCLSHPLTRGGIRPGVHQDSSWDDTLPTSSNEINGAASLQ